MKENLLDEIINKLKLIPELRNRSRYDFCEFNELLSNCNKINKVAEKLSGIINIDDIINNDALNQKDISRKILNYTHETQDTFLCYDIKIYNEGTNYQKQLLSYRKVFEMIFSLLLDELLKSCTISLEYKNYLLNILKYCRLCDYQSMGYNKTPPYRIKSIKTKKLKTIPEKSISTEINEVKLNLDGFTKKIIKLNHEQKQYLTKIHQYWWNSYKEYIDDNFPALSNELKYYKDVKIKVCVTESMTPDLFKDTGLAICVGMLEKKNDGFEIEIVDDIKQKLFVDDEFEFLDYEDVIVTWSFELTDSTDAYKMMDSSIQSDVNTQVINLFKSSIDQEGFGIFTKQVLEFAGYDFAEITSTGLFVSKSCPIKDDGLSRIVVVNDDFVTGKQKYYELSIVEKLNKKSIEKLKRVSNKNRKQLIVTSSIISANLKQQLKEIKDSYFYDIDDLFSLANKKIAFHNYYEKILLDKIIYPFLEKRVGSLTSNKNVVKAEKLIERLSKCAKGLEGWKEFECITKDILEYLFKDNFEHFYIKEQSRNNIGTDIRDFIILNTGTHYFWKDLKQFYESRNIIIESKNTSKEIKNDELRQVSDYLEKDTIGKFGIIFSRLGLSNNAKKKQLEYLTNNRTKKLIIVLNENDIIDLIRKKANGEPPEELLQEIKFELETRT